MSGSGANAGLHYQAEAIAFVASLALSEQSLDWFSDAVDIPTAISAETDGPGDDIRIETTTGRIIEVQVKHGLTKDEHFWQAIETLAQGLVEAPELRGVLLVDSTTSGTIRTDLRFDLSRGRQDRQKRITEEVIARLDGAGVDATRVFPRLRVIEKNLDTGSDGRDAAFAYLSRVLETPSQAATAWKVLADEGDELIKRRGRRDVKAFARLLARHLKLSANCESTLILQERYTHWVAETTSQFYVPGLGVSISINNAWIQLRASGDEQDRRSTKDSFEQMIREYHAWERSADDYAFHLALDVEHLPKVSGRCVVVGGAGSGKSTLAQRVSHHLSQEGNTVLRVRLKLLTRLVEGGDTFDAAVLKVAIDGSGLSLESARNALATPDYLVADGLDECDPNRHTIAQQLRSWCDGHPTCHVIVTTRPVGHDAGLLPGFRHFELLPLDRWSVEDHSLVLFMAACGPGDDSLRRWRTFTKRLDKEREGTHRSVTTLAARNPLLLGFLVRLAIDDETPASNRAELFSQVLRLLEKTSDSTQRSRPPLASRIVALAIDVVGWTLIESPAANADDLLQHIEPELAERLSITDASEKARSALEFWEGSRAIERLTAGHLEAVVFVHPALGEFAAARHAQRLGDDAFLEWIQRVRREPRWHQVVIFAAGIDKRDRVVRTLLDLDEPLDACMTEPMIAATATAEFGTQTPETTQRVIDVLLGRLTSPIPLVSVESALGLLPISRFAADIVGRVSAELLGHEQEWTRLGAIALQLASDNHEFDLDAFEKWFLTFNLAKLSVFGRMDYVSSESMPAEAVDLQYQTVKLGIRRMIHERARSYVEAFFTEHLESRRLSVRMIEMLKEELQTAGFDKLANGIGDRSGLHDISAFAALHQAWVRSRLVLLECIQDACATSKPIKPACGKDRFVLIAAIEAAIQLGESDARDAQYLLQRFDYPSMVEVMKGAIAALGLDRMEVAAEAIEARRLLDEEDISPAVLFPRVSVEPVWGRAVGLSLDTTRLEIALRHPHSSIAYAAAALIEGGAAGKVTRILVSSVLEDGPPMSLYFVSQMAGTVWGKEAASVLWSRLTEGRVGPGCEHLVEALVRMVKDEDHPRLLSEMAKWLCQPLPQFASRVAEALDDLKQPLTKAFEPELRAAFQYWTREGTWCTEHPVHVHGSSCPECGRVLPCPRAGILRLLAKIKSVYLDELILLLDDEQEEVTSTSKGIILDLASNSPATVSSLLDGIDAGKLSMSLLDDVAALPVEVLEKNVDRFIRLVESPNPSVRCAVIRLLNRPWLPEAEATSIARESIADPNPAVRTQAVRTLRTIATRPQPKPKS